jgi:hypothetical protein
MNEATLFEENIPTLTDSFDHLQAFRLMSPAGRVQFIAQLVEKQYGWLRHGDDMTGPVGHFKHGEKVEPDWSDAAISALTTAESQILSTRQLSGHPCIRLFLMTRKGFEKNAHDHEFDHSKFNYFHMYRVDLIEGFGSDVKAGDLIEVAHGAKKIKVPVSQEQLDDHVKISISLGLSE